jgi:hypothetical protein
MEDFMNNIRDNITDDDLGDIVDDITDDIVYELKKDLLEAYDTKMRIINKLKGFITNALDKETLNNLMQELPKKPMSDPSSFLNVIWKFVMKVWRSKIVQNYTNYLKALNLDNDDIEDLINALKSRNKITLKNVFDEIFYSTFTQPLPVEDIRDDVNFFFEDYCAEDKFINYKKFVFIFYSAAFSAFDEKGVFDFEAYLNKLLNELALIDVTLIKKAFSESLELLSAFKEELGSDWDYVQEAHQYIFDLYQDFNDIDYIYIINYFKDQINYFKTYINYINYYINNYNEGMIFKKYSPDFGKSILDNKWFSINNITAH